MVTAASEDAGRATPDVTDLQDWADYFGLTFPIAADPGGATDRLCDPSSRTRPTYVLLAPGVEMVSMGSSVSDVDIEALLPD